MSAGSFHVLRGMGINIHIDSDTRREIESVLRSAHQLADPNVVRYESVSFSDLDGSDVTLLLSSIDAIWESTPENRADAYRREKRLEQEQSALDLEFT